MRFGRKFFAVKNLFGTDEQLNRGILNDEVEKMDSLLLSLLFV